jgi:uncharacterized membrane protein YfhO
VRISRPTVNELTVDVEAPSSCYLVVNETWYPGWIATIDNKSVPILHADHLFRCVEIPKGKHVVRFHYQPLSFWLGVLCFMLTSIGMIIALVLFGNRSGGAYTARSMHASTLQSRRRN